MIANYISSTIIKESLHKKPIFNVLWNPEEIDEWVFRALRKIGVKKQYIMLSKTLSVEGGKTKLPTQLNSLERVVDHSTGQEIEEVFQAETLGLFKYKVNGNYLLFDDSQEDIDITYTSLPLDDNGNALIPDNEYYISAIEAYIRFQLSEKGYYQRKVSLNEVQRLEQEWNFYILSTQNEMKKISSQRFKTIQNKHIL